MSEQPLLLQALGRIELAISQIQTDVGGLKNGQTNLNSYIAAVSSNAKTTEKTLQDHRLEVDAHGGKSLTRHLSTVGSILGIVLGAFALYKQLSIGGH